MNSVLRQRLVGALILIALGAIFWPIIFVDTGLSPVDTRSQIPPELETESFELSKPQPSSQVPQAQTPSEAARDDSAQITDIDLDTERPEVVEVTSTPAEKLGSEAPAPKLDEDGIPIAWELRVISVGTMEKARRIQDELIAMGYKADTRTITSGGRKLVRVTVGPKFDRGTLDKAKLVVDKHYGVNSQVVRYMP